MMFLKFWPLQFLRAVRKWRNALLEIGDFRVVYLTMSLRYFDSDFISETKQEAVSFCYILEFQSYDV